MTTSSAKVGEAILAPLLSMPASARLHNALMGARRLRAEPGARVVEA